MRTMAEAPDKVKAALASGYTATSGQAPQEVARLMAEKTWLDAADAVALGFADRIAEPVRMAARFDVGRFRNTPHPRSTPATPSPAADPPPAPWGEVTARTFRAMR